MGPRPWCASARNHPASVASSPGRPRPCEPRVRALVEAALETGCRMGELLSLQWSQVRFTAPGQLWLPASKTKTRTGRAVPMTGRLRSILEMRRLDPAGEEHGPDA